MEKVFKKFSALLKKRLEEGVVTTEDSVRYTFFAALLEESDILPHEVILEYAHPKIPKAMVDTYIPSKKNRNGSIFEFKYDRKIPTKKNSPRTQKAGKLFNDIYRLTKFDSDLSATAFFVYITDNEMAKYLSSKKNSLSDFFQLPMGEALPIDQNYVASKSGTFRDAIGGDISANVKCVWRDNLPSNHQIRIYEVNSLKN